MAGEQVGNQFSTALALLARGAEDEHRARLRHNLRDQRQQLVRVTRIAARQLPLRLQASFTRPILHPQITRSMSMKWLHIWQAAHV